VSIRTKVILPYLILTLIVAVTGVYVVTRLVANSLNERLTNQLLEAGRVLSDGMARQELKHIEVARLVANTQGLAEALQAGDEMELSRLVRPLAGGLDAEAIRLVDGTGREVLSLLTGSDGRVSAAPASGVVAGNPLVQGLLAGADPQAPPRRWLGQDPADLRYFYYTALPVAADDEIVGVVVIGSSLETILPYLKSVSLADIILYGQEGQAIATTMGAFSLDGDSAASLALPEGAYPSIIRSEQLVYGENFSSEGRWYSVARGPLRISDDRIAVFGVVLPLEFVITPGSASRNTYVFLFTAAMLAVVVIGYIISRLIINPLSSLVRTSQAIAGGDLDRRSGIRSADEIGTLASTFDEMTARLQERTAELEKTNRTLEQMDRTKTSFIDVSAHELRSPLTLVKGYAQMLISKTSSQPELEPLSRGILDGTERMSDIVNNMLDVTRIDSNALKLVPENVQLNSVFLRVEKTFRSSLKERNLSLHSEGLTGLPTIQVDPDLLYKVFYHLVMNAIKYTPDGGTIRILGSRQTDPLGRPEVELAVEDTGIGVAREYQEAIFEKFFQTGEVLLHSSGKTKFKGGGPGLGLAIARGIVNAHAGRIWIESPGQDEKELPGSRFIVRLPLGEESRS
jgi:signal transduction histidine kinase